MQERFEAGQPCEPLETKPPEVYDDLLPVWDAFWVLHKARNCNSMSGTPSAIAFSELKAWMDVFQPDDIKLFVRLIYSLDQAYLSHVQDVTKEEDKKRKGAESVKSKKPVRR
jgi:hypothetical protein